MVELVSFVLSRFRLLERRICPEPAMDEQPTSVGGYA
jgi:hypothetical protein